MPPSFPSFRLDEEIDPSVFHTKLFECLQDEASGMNCALGPMSRFCRENFWMTARANSNRFGSMILDPNGDPLSFQSNTPPVERGCKRVQYSIDICSVFRVQPTRTEYLAEGRLSGIVVVGVRIKAR